MLGFFVLHEELLRHIALLFDVRIHKTHSERIWRTYIVSDVHVSGSSLKATSCKVCTSG